MSVSRALHYDTVTTIDATLTVCAAAATLGARVFSDSPNQHFRPNRHFNSSMKTALQALKDHERVAYDKTAPGSSGTDWHRAYRDMVILLRTFTGHLQCTTAAHQPSRPVPGTDEAAWEKFVADDIARRRRQATAAALGQSEQ